MKINKKIYFSLAIAAMFTFCSCESFLTETNPNKIAVDDYFSTENDVERALNGAYYALRSDYCMGEGSIAYTEERSDNMGRLDNQSSSGEPFQFTDFSLLSSNTYLEKHWNAMFATINYCNYAIKGAQNVTFDNEQDKTNIIAEAKFIRALVYFDVVRKWGDAPLISEYYSTSEEVKAHTYRVPKEQIYALIVEDLKEVCNSTLPDIQPSGNKGHACRAAACALLGKVYLTMASIENDKRNTYLTEAKNYLEQCYNMKKFSNLSEIPYADVFNVNKKSECPEILFQIVYIQGDQNYYSSIASDNQSKGETINSQAVKKGMGNYVNEDLVNDYELSDIRRAWSVKYADDASAKAWFITKYRDTSEAAGTLGYGGNDWIILRYADVILMLAEVNEALGETSTAIKYLDQVRERAGLQSYETVNANNDYKAKYPTLKLAILHERRSELAFENQRWYDLLRFMNTNELIDYFHSKNQNEYGISNLSNFGTKDIYYPIPYDEYLLDSDKMYQNPGY